MSVWFCIPSKRPAPEAQACIDLWRNMGYKTAIWRDTGDEPVECDLLLTGQYAGYARTCNALAAEAVKRGAEWAVFGGDDMQPDPAHKSGDIARECAKHFGGTFGVMQPTGDRWGSGGRVYAEHVAGSAWVGAEFIRRAYGGHGPLWPEYFHMYDDEELQEVAIKLGVFQQRLDLAHFHNHWGRTAGKMPDFLREANRHFAISGAIFARRKALGFPGHELL